jgi:amidophosphoribosyltransferase
VRDSIEADSLAYISLEELIEATEVPKDRLCRACFDGEYPIPLPEAHSLDRQLLDLLPVEAVDRDAVDHALRLP